MLACVASVSVGFWQDFLFWPRENWGQSEKRKEFLHPLLSFLRSRPNFRAAKKESLAKNQLKHLLLQLILCFRIGLGERTVERRLSSQCNDSWCDQQLRGLSQRAVLTVVTRCFVFVFIIFFRKLFHQQNRYQLVRLNNYHYLIAASIKFMYLFYPIVSIGSLTLHFLRYNLCHSLQLTSESLKCYLHFY